MIIVKIQGGLGNQLFQYAFGRALSIKNKCELKLDLSFFDGQDLRKYELNHFSIIEKIATKQDCEDLKKKDSLKLNRLKRKYFKTPLHKVDEEGFAFSPRYLKVGDNTYITGYWQSEKYFSSITHQIKKEFEIKTPPSAVNSALLNCIQSKNAVSLHIRRGDYEKDSVVNKVHGTVLLNYYNEAADSIASKSPGTVFYVFSDDIPWAKQHLKLNHETLFVDVNDGEHAYEDLRLMQNCKHHILANSTFSWWAAWLNPNPDKIIIAPKKWFNDPALNQYSSSIIPETWISI